MSRLSVRPRNTNAARQARLDAERAQALQRQLQADAAHQAERQMIMQANLQAQAASGQMYAQQQNAARLGRSKMADDTTLRQRNRQDAIFNKRQLMDQGWNQHQIDTQQAGIQHALDARMRRLDHQSQMKRDKAQHGYGQDDARLQNKFNVGMEELQHGNMQARDMTQHGYNLARDQQQHGYGQDDARLQQQFAEQNFTDELIEQRTQSGWTRSPGQQREWDTLDEERNRAVRLRRQGNISEADLNKMLGEIHNAKRELIPDLPPPQAQRMTQDEAKGSTWIDESTGALMTQDADGFPIKLSDAPRESGSTGKADDGMGQYLPPAQLAFDKMVMDRWNSQPDKYDAEGNVKGKEFTEAQIRERLLKQYPQMRQFYIEEVPGPTDESINLIRQNREPSVTVAGMPTQVGQMPPQGVPSPMAPPIEPPPNLSGFSGSASPAGAGLGPVGQELARQQRPAIQSPEEALQQQIRIQSQELATDLDNFDQRIEVRRAIEFAGTSQATPVINKLKKAYRKALTLMQNGQVIGTAAPSLAQEIKDLTSQLNNMATGSKPIFKPRG